MMKRIGEGSGKDTGSPRRAPSGSERPASPNRGPVNSEQSPSPSRAPAATKKSGTPSQVAASPKKLLVKSGRLSPDSAEILGALQKIYDEFTHSASPGQEQKRLSIVDAVLAKQSGIFPYLKPQHFAVLLSIAPEKMSAAIAQYFSDENKSAFFQAMITEPVVNPLAVITTRQEFDVLINQWVEQEFVNQHLYRYRELLHWMYLKRRFRLEHWTVLLDELCQGRFRELLDDQTGLGPTLWDKLCVFLGKNTEIRDQCLSDEQFLSDYLLHLSLENRKALFKEVLDPALMRRIFQRCASSRQHMHVLCSVLNTCFTEIHNEHFYKELMQYPHFMEYACAVAAPDSIDSFVKKHEGKPWCSPAIFSVQIPHGSVDEVRSKVDEDRISAFLDGILDDQSTSEELPEVLVVDYYLLGLPATRAQMLANPTLMSRLLVLRDANKIRIQLHSEILLLMRWMLSELVEEQPVDFTHLFRSDAMAVYFIGAVEWLFCQLHERDNAKFLENLFEHFGPDFFSGITIGQLGQLAKMRGNTQIIFDVFEKRCPEIVNCYRTLRAARDEDLKKTWSQTVGKTAEFLDEFMYKGPDDDERWMRLLWCNWDQTLKSNVVVDELMRHAVGLRFADFLMSIAQTPRINHLFSHNIYLAKMVITHPELFGGCRFTLENFTHWNFRLLWLVISDPVLHKAYGFTSEDFYRLVVAPNRENVFKKPNGFLAELLSFERLSGDAKNFLSHTFLTAPPYVQARTVQDETPVAVPESRADSSPWVATGRSCDTYEYKNEFRQSVDEDKLLSRQVALMEKGAGRDEWQAFLNEVSKKDYLFILRLLKDPKVLAKLEAEKGSIEHWQHHYNEAISAKLKTIKATETTKEITGIGTVLNNSPLLRSVRIMRNPKWLDIAIRCSRHVEYIGLDSNVTCYLQLPGFLPTTADLSPSYLYFDTSSVAVKDVVMERPIKMVEYLISLCHYSFVDLDGDVAKIMVIRERAAILVEVGIKAYFRELQKRPPRPADDHYAQRFVCLFCSATEFLEPEVLLEILNTNKALRNQLCRWLLTYNLSTSGYDLFLMSELPENGMPMKGRIYLDKYLDEDKVKLKYLVMTLNGIIEDILDIPVNEELTSEILISLKDSILAETSNRGHTLTVSVGQVPALVRVQMLMLRSFASDQQLAQKPSAEDIENKNRSLDFINEILWQFRCIALGAMDLLNEDTITTNYPAYQLDLPLLEQLPMGKYLANLLRYESLTSRLTEKDLITLVRRDEGDIARACLLHASLHNSLHNGGSVDFISECIKKLGYGEDPREMLEKFKEDWGWVIEGSPTLQEWVSSMEYSLGRQVSPK